MPLFCRKAKAITRKWGGERMTCMQTLAEPQQNTFFLISLSISLKRAAAIGVGVCRKHHTLRAILSKGERKQ